MAATINQDKKELEKKFPGYTATYIETKPSGNYYFQLTEYVDDHRNTLDWFTVNPKTGKYTTDFGTYTGTLTF